MAKARWRWNYCVYFGGYWPCSRRVRTLEAHIDSGFQAEDERNITRATKKGRMTNKLLKKLCLHVTDGILRVTASRQGVALPRPELNASLAVNHGRCPKRNISARRVESTCTPALPRSALPCPALPLCARNLIHIQGAERKK